jgi:hypothetical protein
MPLNINDTATLNRVQGQLPVIPSYWLGSHFPQEQTFETEHIDFETVESDLRIAPYVNPLVEGKVMKDLGSKIARFNPAYVKPKHVINPSRTLKRKAGEAYNGSMSLEQRKMAIITENLKLEKDMVFRRLEVMATEAIIHGRVTVTGEDYEAVVVDFGRDAGNTVVLSGAARWNQTGSTIKENIESEMAKVQILTGFAPTRITMSPDVWNIFRKDADIKEDLNTDFAGRVATLDRSVGNGMPVQFKGWLSSTLEVYVNSGTYKNDAGQVIQLQPAGTVVLSSPEGVKGVRCFGAIMDLSSLVATSMFARIIDNSKSDPSIMETLTQCAPLMVPSNPNATLYMKVY